MSSKNIHILILAMFAIMAGACSSNDNTKWDGKRVAFLGDSMTDPANTSADHKYWTILHETTGIKPYVYARSGYDWRALMSKAEAMHDELGDDVDAIFIWCGTNDYNHGTPIGEFYTESIDTVNVNGEKVVRKHRKWEMVDSTYCGNINRVLSYLKTNYPTKQIVVMTPIHRGYARFSETNVQPDEDYANGQGLYIEDYVDVLRRGAAYWGIPVIDLYGESGIYPNLESNTPYVGNAETDRLHPNNAGHRRIADVMRTWMNSHPATF